jgi:antitoxin (DNA-binding transcriptional repressor) of toxin-antitoxin stability system
LADWFEHAPDDYISKEDIAAYYRKYPHEWDDMRERVGFGEDKQAEFDLRGLREAVRAGKEYTIMQDGKPVAKVAPVEKKPRVPGRFAHLRGSLPPDLFDQPLEQDELDAWEGKYSGDRDR